MESNLEILDSIMKPYFDKKKEIENVPFQLEKEKQETANAIREMRNERINRRKELELELENVRVRHKIAIEDFKEKMEKEIEEYINSTISSNPNLTAAYGTFIRNDLKRSHYDNDELRMGYDDRLKQLEDRFKTQEEALLVEIANLKVVTQEEKNNKQALDRLGNQLDNSRVDLREMVEIKDELRKKLFQERKRLSLKLNELKPEYEEYNKIVEDLKQYQIKLNEIVDKLSNFKYEYNEQNQVVNNDEWKVLQEERVLISNKITDLTNVLIERNNIIHEVNDVKKSLDKIEEYLTLTELTKEETAAVMMSMTPWEKAEYDRRKGDLVEIDDNKEYTYEEQDREIVVEDMENLISVIFNDVVKTISNLKSVKINGSKKRLGKDEYYISSKTNGDPYKQVGTVKADESIKLPCGEYVNKADIVEAAEKLYTKPKAITYIVKETGKVYEMSKDAVNRLKQSLKKCTTINLVRENKLSKLDLLKVFGKKKTNDVMEQVQIGELKHSNLEEGEYINKNETIVAFEDMFVSKKLHWLKKLVGGLKDKKEKMEQSQEKKFESMTLNDEFYKIDLQDPSDIEVIGIEDELDVKQK